MVHSLMHLKTSDMRRLDAHTSPPARSPTPARGLSGERSRGSGAVSSGLPFCLEERLVGRPSSGGSLSFCAGPSLFCVDTHLKQYHKRAYVQLHVINCLLAHVCVVFKGFWVRVFFFLSLHAVSGNLHGTFENTNTGMTGMCLQYYFLSP